MNYEEKYKEALERAKKVNNGKLTISPDEVNDFNVYEYIFPELAENKDERIRKELIEHFRWNAQILNDFDNKDVIAWLEKQGEEKPTPKFKIGDTIHKIGENTVFSRTIEKIENGDYVCNNSHSFVNIKFQDDYELVKQESAWSEEDEKLYTSALWHIKNSCGNGGKDSGEYEVYNWLKFIKYRVQPQSKQEWSEVDEKMLESTLQFIDGHRTTHPLASKCYDWLKSISLNRIGSQVRNNVRF